MCISSVRHSTDAVVSTSTSSSSAACAKTKSVVGCCLGGETHCHFVSSQTLSPEVRASMPKLQPLNPELYTTVKEVSGTEWVYNPHETAHHGWSTAFVDIIKSPPHFHKKMVERYTVMSGSLVVYLNGIGHVLGAGDSVQIKPEIVHWAKSLDKEPARITCTCWPAFTVEDYHPVSEDHPLAVPKAFSSKL